MNYIIIASAKCNHHMLRKGSLLLKKKTRDPRRGPVHHTNQHRVTPKSPGSSATFSHCHCEEPSRLESGVNLINLDKPTKHPGILTGEIMKNPNCSECSETVSPQKNPSQKPFAKRRFVEAGPSHLTVQGRCHLELVRCL